MIVGSWQALPPVVLVSYRSPTGSLPLLNPATDPQTPHDNVYDNVSDNVSRARSKGLRSTPYGNWLIELFLNELKAWMRPFLMQSSAPTPNMGKE